jgi:hypothetical protein
MADNKKIQSIAGLGGMDYDSDEKYIQDGDYKYIVNGIKIGIGEDGVIVNAPGNENTEEVASTFLVDNSGSYIVDDLDTITSTERDGNIPSSKIVGHCKDPKRNGIILFLQGDSTSSIYEFFAAGQIYVPILKNNSTIHINSDVVDMTVIGDRLYWLERGGSPRTLNILKAYNYTHNKGGDAYNSITEEIISLIKKPPLYDIDLSYGKDSNFNGSHVFDKMFQFRHQYIYEDSLKSAFGNTSEFVYNPSSFAENGSLLKDSQINNYISVKFNSGDEHVEKIKIAARDNMEGDWYQVAVIDKENPRSVYNGSGSLIGTALSDDTDYYFYFYNTGGYDVIPFEDIEKSYENIPIESYNMGAFENNRLIFGMNKIDYGDINIGSSSCSPKYYDRPDHPYVIDVVWEDSKIATDADTDNDIIQAEYVYDLSNLPSTLKEGTVIYLRYAMKLEYDNSGTTYYFLAPDDGSGGGGSSDEILDNYVVLESDVTKTYFRENILDYIAFDTDDCYSEEEGSQVSVTFEYSALTDNEILVRYKWYPGDSGRTNLNVLSREDNPNSSLLMSAYELYDSVKPSLKRGRSGQGAFQYLDKYGRKGEPQFNDATSFTVDEYGDDASPKGAVGLEFSITHTPPDWAYYYQFLMSYQKLSFIQTIQMFSAPYLDYNGNSDGSIALFLGFPTQVLKDAVQDEIDELESKLGDEKTKLELEKQYIKVSKREKSKWYNIDLFGITEDNINDAKSRVEEKKERVQEIERQIELKKYELSNQYKRALANVKRYHFSKNDRVRIIKAKSGTNSYDSSAYVSDVLDFRILDVLDSIDYSNDYSSTSPTTYNGLWLKVVPPNRDGFEVGSTTSVPSIWDNALIEVYKPSYSDSTKRFYEIPGIYTITNPGTAQREHEDQGTTVAVRPNNCFFRIREMYLGEGPLGDLQYKSKIVDWTEDPYISHEFKSDNYDLGRVFVSTDTEKGKVHSNLVYTNAHLEGTDVNGLSQSDYTNMEYLSEEYGDIYGVFKSGNTLKVVQAKKITSFYPSGNSILGKMRRSQTDYGCVYPKAMVDSPYGYRYGFDVYNGVIWRDTNNGVYNLAGRSVVRGGVSDYKMGKYFRDVAKDVRDNGIQKGSDDVIAAYDEKYELVYFSFLQENLDSNIVPYRTVIFHEPSNRWVGFLDIQPTGYAYGYNTLLSSNESDGNIYLHGREETVDGTANYNNFYGAQKDFEAEFVANIMPSIQKVFDAMAIHATTKFSVPEMTIAKNSTTINEKFSKLNTNHFVLQEGVYKSEILGNMKTTSDTAKASELYSGDRMRGYAMNFKIRSSDSEKFELFKVDVYVDPYAT